MASEKMRGFGVLQSFCYLQLLLAGDNETGRKSRTISKPRPLARIKTNEK